MHFSPSALEDYLKCPRYWYIRRQLGLKKPDRTDLSFGIAIHQGVAKWWQTRDAKQAVEAFALSWNEQNVPATEKRSLEIGMVVIGKYCAEYKNDPADYLPELVESEQTLEMPNGTTLKVRVDRVRSVDKHYIVVDTKTTSMALTPYYFTRYLNSFQMGGYDYVVLQLFGACHGVQIEGVRTPYSSTSVSFSRFSMPERTALQRADWLNTYNNVTARIKEGTEITDEQEQAKHFFCNQKSCSDFGGCEYLPICTYGLTHPSVVTEFVKEDKAK